VHLYSALLCISKALRYGPCVTRGSDHTVLPASHKPKTNHTCLYLTGRFTDTSSLTRLTTRQTNALTTLLRTLSFCQRIVLSAKCLVSELVCQRNVRQAENKAKGISHFTERDHPVS